MTQLHPGFLHDERFPLQHWRILGPAHPPPDEATFVEERPEVWRPRKKS